MLLGRRFEMVRGLFLLRFFLTFLKVRDLGAFFFLICMRKLATNRTVPVLAKKYMYQQPGLRRQGNT